MVRYFNNSICATIERSRAIVADIRAKSAAFIKDIGAVFTDATSDVVEESRPTSPRTPNHSGSATPSTSSIPPLPSPVPSAIVDEPRPSLVEAPAPTNVNPLTSPALEVATTFPPHLLCLQASIALGQELLNSRTATTSWGIEGQNQL